jgi:hypothetical protein
MIDEKKLKKLIEKLDFGDWRMLGIGILLLFLPLAFIGIIANTRGGGIETDMDPSRLDQMVKRKNVFNFGKKQTDKATQRNKASSGSSWVSQKTPDQLVQDELQAAMGLVERSRVEYDFPRDFTETQKQAYMAEHNPSLCNARGALERRDYSEAERLIKQALDESLTNPFLRVYALGELCALYEKTHNLKGLEAAFKLYMEAVGQIPEGYGGGDLSRLVKDTYMSMKYLKETIDQGQASQHLSKDELAKELGFSASDLSVGLQHTLDTFPVKFD